MDFYQQEIDEYQAQSQEYSEHISHKLNNIKNCLDRLTYRTGIIKGETALSIDAFINEVHFPVIKRLKNLIEQYKELFDLIQKDFYETVDENGYHINDDFLEDLTMCLNKSLENFDDLNDRVVKTRRKYSDVITKVVSFETLGNSLYDTKNYVNKAREDFKDFNDRHKNDLNDFLAEISEIKEICNKHNSSKITNNSFTYDAAAYKKSLGAVGNLFLIDNNTGEKIINLPKLHYYIDHKDYLNADSLNDLRQLLNNKTDLNIESFEEIIDALLLQYSNIQIDIDNVYNGMDIKRAFILLFEYRHPEFVSDFANYSDFLSPFTCYPAGYDDIINIKTKTYLAPDKYFQLMMDLASTDCQILIIEAPDFSLDINAINLDGNILFTMDTCLEFSTDPCGVYDTFFHESGHAIDNRFGTTAGKTDLVIVPRFDTAHGKITEALREQVRKDILDYMNSDSFKEKNSKLNNAEKEKILKYIFQGNSNKIDLKKELKKGFDNIKDYFESGKLYGPNNSAVSDAWSAVTNNKISNYGHNNMVLFFDAYWYDPVTNNPSNRQSAEFFASDFAAQITGNINIQKANSTNFPLATELARAYLRELADNQRKVNRNEK